jgi:predicted transcriptional regulator
MDILAKYRQLSRFITERNVIKLVSQNNFGINLDNMFEPGYEVIFENHVEFAAIDPNTSFYVYTGPRDEKNRDFCRLMLDLDKFFTQENIDRMSLIAGYNVDFYMGSYNCRHKWVRARIKGKIQEGYIPPTPTDSQINKIGRRAI